MSVRLFSSSGDNHAETIDEAYKYFWDDQSPEEFMGGTALSLDLLSGMVEVEIPWFDPQLQAGVEDHPDRGPQQVLALLRHDGQAPAAQSHQRAHRVDAQGADVLLHQFPVEVRVRSIPAASSALRVGSMPLW